MYIILLLETTKMENDAGEFVDLYCPRKWLVYCTCYLLCTKFKLFSSCPCSSASNRIIHAKDHASIQINLVDVNPQTGVMTDTSKVYAICGEIRRMGESDDCIARLAKKDGVLSK